MKYVGVDGCKGGWFAVWVQEERWAFSLYPDFPSLFKAHEDASLILLDMPVGLSDTGARASDALARQRLGGKRSSLFNTPVRDAVYAPTKAEARAINKQATGKSLTEQSLGLVKKILDVDGLLIESDKARALVRESHPELAFDMVAGRPLKYGKRDVLGVVERFELLDSLIPEFREFLARVREAFPLSKVAGDDILDACILAVSAWKSGGKLRPLPDPPERDGKGLPMAIWYPDFGA